MGVFTTSKHQGTGFKGRQTRSRDLHILNKTQKLQHKEDHSQMIPLYSFTNLRALSGLGLNSHILEKVPYLK